MTKSPIKGLIQKRGEYYIVYDATDESHPYALWHGDTWSASYSKLSRARAEMDYRLSLGDLPDFMRT